MDNRIHHVALIVRFKEYLLACDLPSRRKFLQAAIRYAEKSDNDMKPQVITWLRNYLYIVNSDDIYAKSVRVLKLNNEKNHPYLAWFYNRGPFEKERDTRYDFFWEELYQDYYDLSRSTLMCEIMQHVIGSD